MEGERKRRGGTGKKGGGVILAGGQEKKKNFVTSGEKGTPTLLGGTWPGSIERGRPVREQRKERAAVQIRGLFKRCKKN